MLRRIVLGPLVVLLTATSCATLAPAAATVNGERIPEVRVEEELDIVRADPNYRELVRRQGDAFRGEERRNILTALIHHAVARQGAADFGIRVSDEQISEYVEELIREVGGQERYDELVAEAGLTERWVRTRAERQILQQELARAVTADLEVDEEQVRAFYERNRAAFEEVHLRRITVPDDAEAVEVMGELQAGADFQDVARQRSIDEAAPAGGDVGYIPSTNLDGELLSELERIPEGGVTSPVSTPAGVQLYQLVDRRPMPLADVRDQIEDQLLAQDREQAFGRWLTEHIQQARVIVNPKFGVFDPDSLRVVAGPDEIPE